MSIFPSTNSLVLFLSVSAPPFSHPKSSSLANVCRYEIANGNASWEEAEKQVRASLSKKEGSNIPTVSVKSSKQPKRKAGESAREIYEKEIASKDRKKIKRGTEGRSRK